MVPIKNENCVQGSKLQKILLNFKLQYIKKNLFFHPGQALFPSDFVDINKCVNA